MTTIRHEEANPATGIVHRAIRWKGQYRRPHGRRGVRRRWVLRGPYITEGVLVPAVRDELIRAEKNQKTG